MLNTTTGKYAHIIIAEGFKDLDPALWDADIPAERYDSPAEWPTPDEEAAAVLATVDENTSAEAPFTSTEPGTVSRQLPLYLRDIPDETLEGYEPSDLENWLWTDIIIGDEYIGTILNCDELGVKAINADRDIVGMFADKDAAETTLFDRWYRARQANGGVPPVNEKPDPAPDKGDPTPGDIAGDIDTRTVMVTFFPNKSAQSQHCSNLTLPQLAEQIRLETAPTKLELPWLKLMTFGNTRSAKGCLRTNANAKEITGIEVEHDKGEIAFDTAIAVMREAKVRSLLYTSPSYIPASKERWRILLPLSDNWQKEMRKMLVARVNGLFGGKLAPESFNLSQAYLYGSVNGNPAHRAEVIDGDFIDLCDDLDPGAIGKSPTGKEKPDKEQPGKDKSAKAGRQADALEQAIRKSTPKGERSETVWFAINEMLRRGYRPDAIVQVLLDRKNGVSEHIFDQAEPHEYATRQVEQAIEKIEFICSDRGKILPTVPANIRIALLKLGVGVRYDQFADRTLLDGLPGYGPALEDAAVHHLWLQFSERLQFHPNLELVRIVMDNMARLNGFHPVCDYLDALQWDGVPRIDKWLTTYAGAEDNKYTQAVGALVLIALVRRVRQPGCKFDEMMILEQPTQGTDKSSGLAILAVKEKWFADDLPLNVEGKRVIETLRGRWIIEAAELSGMRKADIGHLNALLSRRIDRARMAWGRLPIEAPRQCCIIGTTNKAQYLRDTTGNRRYWPVLIVRFDLDALRRDRDQLWAEAAAREARGESIRLARELWPEAAKEQRQRLADDPFVEVLANHLGHLEGKIKAADVWEILNLHGAQLTQDAYARAAEAMKRIGWKRPNTAGTARFGGQLLTAYVRGDTRTTITVSRSPHGLSIGKMNQTGEVKDVSGPWADAQR
jgi:Virulence-associated protein E-like domain